MQYHVTRDPQQLGLALEASTPEGAASDAATRVGASAGDVLIVRWDVRFDERAPDGWSFARGREVTVEAGWIPAAKPKAEKAEKAAKAEKAEAKPEAKAAIDPAPSAGGPEAAGPDPKA